VVATTVAPIRDIGNKSLFTSVCYISTSNMAPTSDMKMVVSSINDIFESNCNNCNEVRGHFLVSSMHSLRTSFMSLSECDEDYSTKA